jgi:hypothetical protein
MCSIYLINVGANTNHSSQARSPLFDGGSFVYVSFCADPNKEEHYSEYPPEMLPFTHPDKDNLKTHNDPDWHKLTYGDDCSNPRAAVLKKVNARDILLFWGLLCRNDGNSWDDFVSPLEKGWYLLGALRVEDIIKGKKQVNEVHPHSRHRAQQNTHFSSGVLPNEEYVFLGVQEYSQLFSRAIDLGVRDPRGLVYEAFTSADGNLLRFNCKPDWFRSLRPCRRMWDINKPRERALAKHVRDAIRANNSDFDLLKDTRC